MKQQSLAVQGVFEKYGRKSRRELFLDENGAGCSVVCVESSVRPHYAKQPNPKLPRRTIAVTQKSTACAEVP